MTRAGICLSLLIAVLILLGCGGGQGQVALDSNAPPLDFTFHPAAESMPFSVDLSSEAEIRGTSIVSRVRFHWNARDWREEDGAWTAEVVFSDVSAAVRRGSSVAMEPVKEFDRLEGYALRYRKDAKGFAPVSEPAEDRTFRAMFNQIQVGMSPLDFKIPADPVRPGASWQEAIDRDKLDELGQVLVDSTLTRSYAGDELFKGRPCALIDYDGKIRLDGEVPGSEGSSRIDGSMEVDGRGQFDRERGFFLREQARIKQIINRQPLDEKGKPKAKETSFVQNVDVTIAYLGE